MKIIDRYVGKNVFITMLIGVMVLSLVLVVGNLLKELLDRMINQNVPLEIVLAFMAFVLPFSLTFSIPWGLLTAVLLVFGRMSADNELIALRSNGVSIPRICIPVFVLAAAMTGLCFWINADVAPKAAMAMQRSLFEVATNNPIALFSADEVVDQFPDRRVYVGSKKGNTLLNLTIIEINRDNAPVKVIFAKRGELVPDPEHQRLMLNFYDARFEQRDADDPRDIFKIQHGIVMESGSFPISLAAKVELHRRFSSSLACLAFALVAVPLGITTHRKETSVGFALSLVIAFTYYLFIIIANTFRDNPHAFPQILIWAPNVLFMTLGSVLFVRLCRR